MMGFALEAQDRQWLWVWVMRALGRRKELGDLARNLKTLVFLLHSFWQREAGGGVVCPEGLGAQQILVLTIVVMSCQVKLLVL